MSTLTYEGSKPVQSAPLSERLHVWWRNLAHWKTGRAMRDLKKALQKDPDYAHSWKANLAMAIYDESSRGGLSTSDKDKDHVCVSMQQCDATADRIMKQFFNV